MTLIRLEGIAASVADRAGSLSKALASFGAVETLQDTASAATWRAIRDVEPFAARGSLGAWPVWRIVCPPAAGGALGQQLARDTGGDVIYDWGGGLIWAALPPKPDAQAALVRAARRGCRRPRHADPGHRTGSIQCRRIPSASRADWLQLSERVRHSFDPKTILNRGRLTRGSRS